MPTSKVMQLPSRRVSSLSRPDEVILKELYVCFDRPAFRIPFEHEADLNALMEAIDDTIAAINTGVKRTRSGLPFGKLTKGKAYLKDDEIRALLDEVVDSLSMAKVLYAQARAAGYFFDMSQIGRKGIAFHGNHNEEATKVAVMIDETRNRVIEIVNRIYRDIGLREFPYIKTPEYYKKGMGFAKIKAQVPKNKFSFISIIDVLELKPNFFGLGINFNELRKSEDVAQ